MSATLRAFALQQLRSADTVHTLALVTIIDTDCYLYWPVVARARARGRYGRLTHGDLSPRLQSVPLYALLTSS